MKKFIYVMLLFTLLFSCKRKQELLSDSEIKGIVVKTEGETCYNGIQDTNEDGIDCGGNCFPCEFVPTPVCTPATNTLKINSSVISATVTSCGASGSNFIISGIINQGTFTITIVGSNPNQTTVYNVVGYPFSSDEASIEISSPFYANYLLSNNGGYLYIKKVSGKYQVTICNAGASNSFSTINVSLSGMVVCP